MLTVINSLGGYFLVTCTQNSEVLGINDSKGKRKKHLVKRNKLMEFEEHPEQNTCFCHCFLCLNQFSYTEIFVVVNYPYMLGKIMMNAD